MLRLYKQEKFLMKFTLFFKDFYFIEIILKPRKTYYIGFSKTTKNNKTTVL